MLRSVGRAFIVLGSLLAVPIIASAQATIAGTAKDASGGVLPGVTVEASSPALIEKSRSVVTDSTGQYKITQLRPGTYAVTFTLTGFNTVKREGVELAGEFTAAVNVELKVGALEETITVTGETPIVDVQSATKERVLTSDVVEAVPTSRVYASLAITIPGVTNGGVTQDVGGTTGGIMTNMLVHDSKQDSQRITQNGLSLAVNIGFRAPAAPNMGAFQELAVDTGAVDATTATGGVRINFIPRDGGNTFKGLGFFSFANGSMQSNNFSQDLKALGLTTPNSVERLWDVNPGLGGPLKRDKLWFYGTLRQLGAYNFVGNTFSNANAYNPNAWVYVADTSRPAVTQQIWSDAQVRLTWQATPKNKLAVTYQQDDINGNPPFGCNCIMLARTANAPTSPEAATAYRFPLERLVQADWTSPLTNRLLLDGAIQSHTERYDTDDVGYLLQPPGSTMISVTEQGGAFPGLTYRAPAAYGNQWMWVLLYRASLSYITGAHAFKVGFNNGTGHNDIATTLHVPYSYRFNNGVPNLLTLRTPSFIPSKYNYDMGLYAQDKWTISRLTFSYGLRFDAFGNTIPAQFLGPAALAPSRNYSFPEQSNLAFKDITPHLSAIYDVFGTGRTAVRASVNKYLAGLINFGTGLVSTPGTVNNVVASTTRSWTDSNGNFKPDCDLLNPNAQTIVGGDICGRDANTAFGTLGPGAIWDPSLLTGWNHRNYNWEFSAGVQQEVLPRVSVDVGYYRRIYGNFQVSTNINTTASNFNPFSVTAPADPRLPNGGGYTISGLYDLNPAQFGQPAQLYNTLSETYGSQIEHYNGVDMTVNARLRSGLLLQGGISTGKTVTDNCAIVAKLPDQLISGSTVTPQVYCHISTPFLTQAQALGSYEVPKIGVRVSATFQSLPGPQVAGFQTVPNAAVVGSLGRNLSAGANQNVSVNLIAPGSLYGDRMNELDFRIGKIFRLGRMRAAPSLDLYNALNANPVTSETTQYAAFRQPTNILQARLLKLSLQLDF